MASQTRKPLIARKTRMTEEHTNLIKGFQEQGMTQQEIIKHFKEKLGVEHSQSSVSRVMKMNRAQNAVKLFGNVSLKQLEKMTQAQKHSFFVDNGYTLLAITVADQLEKFAETGKAPTIIEAKHLASVMLSAQSVQRLAAENPTLDPEAAKRDAAEIDARLMERIGTLNSSRPN